MSKPAMFDAEALISMFESATAKQGEQLRKATGDALLAAMQGRELTLKNIRGALKAVSEAASTGAARNLSVGIDPEELLEKAVAGIDDAMLKAVEANRTALSTLMAQGADMRDKHLTKALSDLEKMEDTLLATLKKTAQGAATPMAGAWNQVLEKMQAGGTLSGAKAATTAEQIAEQMAEQMAKQVQTAVRSTRAASMRAAQALAESYAAMASGVLIGMSEALQMAGSAKKPPRK
jgi:hypothetical protein